MLNIEILKGAGQIAGDKTFSDFRAQCVVSMCVIDYLSTNSLTQKPTYLINKQCWWAINVRSSVRPQFDTPVHSTTPRL